MYFTSCSRTALCQAVTPPELVSRTTGTQPELVSRAMWTQPKLGVSCTPYIVPEADQRCWDVGFSRPGCLWSFLTRVSSLPREPGTSVGKKYDGECKKAIAIVSELHDEGPGFSPADVRRSNASVCSSPQASSILQECNCCCASAQGRFCFLHV